MAGLDIVTVAWIIGSASWLDRDSRVIEALTLGGRPMLMLGLALLGFAMLVTLGVITDGFESASQLQLAVIAIASAISVFALAGVLLGVLLLVVGAVLLGLLARFFMRR